MTTLNKEIYEAFQATGIDDTKAKAAAASVYEKEQIATKVDIAELKTEIGRIAGKLTVLIALNIAVLLAAIGPHVAKLFGRW